MFAVVTLTRGF